MHRLPPDSAVLASSKDGRRSALGSELFGTAARVSVVGSQCSRRSTLSAASSRGAVIVRNPALCRGLVMTFRDAVVAYLGIGPNTRLASTHTPTIAQTL
jgi:hypothetical protein